MVVDDSIVVRKMVTDVINSATGMTVAGTARNGVEALARLADVAPDIMTLDIEMPDMDGLETLRRLRDIRPDIPVIMFSTLTVQGSEATLDALTLGARDYVAKPANVGSVTAVVEELERELVPRVRALAGPRFAPPATPSATGSAPTTTASTVRRSDDGFGNRMNPIEAVVVASSTGGPVALEEVLSSLSRPLPVPMFITQHIPPVFSGLLAARLDGATSLRVTEGVDGEVSQPGHVYLAPGGFHMRLARTANGVITRIHDDPPIQYCRPAADAMFGSAVDVYGGNLLAVVLTGMGHDGRDGCEMICAAGGSVLAQDEATSVVWGMPGAVTEAGLANEVVPLGEVAERIESWLTKHGTLTGAMTR